MRGKRDLHPSFFGLCQLILLLALILGGRPNARFNWIFFVPIFILFSYSVFFCASDSPISDFAFIQVFVYVIPFASDYILLRSYQPELRKIGQRKATPEMTVIEHLRWAASLLATYRGIGWAHEPTAHLPPRPTASRWKFIASQLLWMIYYFILFDVARIHSHQNPCFGIQGPSFTAFGWGWQTTVWVYIVSVYCTMSGLYAAASIVSVATGIDQPRDWPHLFGTLRNAYTVRKCWGRVWHQMLRRIFTSHSNFLAKALHLPKGTFTTYFKLFVSFFISGLMHAAPDYIFHQNFSEGTSVRFFILQAVAITFEDTVIDIASRLGYKESKASKLIGFIWVFMWFTFCMPIWLDPQLHAGTVDEKMRAKEHVSLILGLMESLKF